MVCGCLELIIYLLLILEVWIFFDISIVKIFGRKYILVLLCKIFEIFYLNVGIFSNDGCEFCKGVV